MGDQEIWDDSFFELSWAGEGGVFGAGQYEGSGEGTGGGMRAATEDIL